MNLNMIKQEQAEGCAATVFAPFGRIPAAAFLALACLMMSAPAALADCPPGWTNTGATCTNILSNPSRVADCPAGYTNMGLTCTRPGDTIASGGSRPADCPAGYTNIGSTCNDGLFKIKLMSEMTCHPDEFRNQTRCYKNCPAGYTNTGLTCTRSPDTVGTSAMKCTAGEFFNSGRCYKNCPAGYTSTGETCTRGVDTVGTSAMKCNAGSEFFGSGRCYKNCPEGWTSTGETCTGNRSTLTQADITWNAPPSVAQLPVYNIAHMVTTDEAVDWAVSQGANGLEMDLQFHDNGQPWEFRHSQDNLVPCDCICGTGSQDHVCTHLNGATNKCMVSAPAQQHLQHIAGKNGVGLVYIDSKLANLLGKSNEQKTAGALVVDLLSDALFGGRGHAAAQHGAGYKGIAIVTAPSSDFKDYLKAASDEAFKLGLQSDIYFAIDMDNGGKPGAQRTIGTLQSVVQPSPAPGPHRVIGADSPNKIIYGSGVSSCAPGIFLRDDGWCRGPGTGERTLDERLERRSAN